MASLSAHYLEMKEKHPDKDLMIVFDIDDTIVDIRIPLLFNLKKYDIEHDTNYFQDLELDDITIEEWHIQDWLPTRIDDPSLVQRITNYVRNRMWKKDTILLSHKPFQGVLEIIRWFQIQQKTFVGLNTGRSNELRDITLESLNILGKEYRVQFTDELLYMNPLENKDDKDVTSYKSKGIQYFKNEGYKVIAFIDNEPANLRVVDNELQDSDLMLFHAETIFGSSKKLRPSKSIVGQSYNITEVIDPINLPHHIEFIWNGVNNFSVYHSYKNSNVYWAELDVRKHPLTEDIVLKHGSFDTYNFDTDQLALSEMIDEINQLNKGIKVVLKEDEGLLDELIEYFNKLEINSERLWFDIIFEVFDVVGLNKIKENFPNSIISTRVDFLVPLLSQLPESVKEILDKLSSFGISQFSVSIDTYNKEIFMEKMDEWNFQVNIRDIYKLEEFLQAIILLPDSIISTFEFRF